MRPIEGNHLFSTRRQHYFSSEWIKIYRRTIAMILTTVEHRAITRCKGGYAHAAVYPILNNNVDGASMAKRILPAMLEQRCDFIQRGE